MTPRHVWVASVLILSSMSCSLFTTGLHVSQSTASTPRASDVDRDGVEDLQDNCSLTANGGQEDGDRNGVGDACESPWDSGLAFQSPFGIIQASVDDRLRLLRIAGQGSLLEFNWAADATTVDLAILQSGEDGRVRLPVDLSDAGLLAALDGLKELPGAEEIRTWLAANPQRVHDVARGAEPAPQPTTPPTSGLTPVDFQASFARLPAAQVGVETYLDQLAIQGAIAMEVLAAFNEKNPVGSDPSVETARALLNSVSYALTAVYMGQYLSCEVSCTTTCRIPCAYPGACNVFAPRPFCTLTSALRCMALDGAFSPGEACPSACWLSTERSQPACEMLDIPTCIGIGQRANQGGMGFDVTPVPCPGQTCDDPMCAP
jgi:hypothetical protein